MANTTGLIADLSANGKNGRTWNQLAQQYGYSDETTVRRGWKRAKKVAKIQEKQETQNYIAILEDRVISLEEDIKNGSASLVYRSKEEIKTEAELVEKAKIDLKKYKIVRIRHNFWGNDNNPHWQVRADLEPRKLDKDPELQKDFLIEEIKKYKRTLPKPDISIDQIFGPSSNVKKKYLLELDIPDLHIGKLAWGEETGEDYDLNIAIERYRKAIDVLLSRIPLVEIEQIILPVGNDLIHIDNAENQTTAGTIVDTDSRFAKIVKVAKKLLIQTVDRLKQIAPVHIIIVRGNHDSTVTLLLGEVLDAWFHAESRVTVDNGPQWRKYYIYGKVGVQLTHGEKEKHEELGQIFAHEQPQIWAATKYRFCKLGHFHKSKKLTFVSVDSMPGFQIQVIPSLSGTDEWHSGKGYLSNKQAKAFLYHKEEGEIAEYTYTV